MNDSMFAEFKKNQNQQRQTIHSWHFSFTHTWLKRKHLTRDLGAVSCCLGFIKKNKENNPAIPLTVFLVDIPVTELFIHHQKSSPQTNEIQMTTIQMVTTWGFKTRENVCVLLNLTYLQLTYLQLRLQFLKKQLPDFSRNIKNTMTSNSCCRCVGRTSMMRIFHSTTSSALLDRDLVTLEAIWMQWTHCHV